MTIDIGTSLPPPAIPIETVRTEKVVLSGTAVRSPRCRTNSRRGLVDPDRRSYPPVQSVCRALDVLKAVNKLRIASVNCIYEETGIPKPTIVRMLETFIAEGYLVRDNMCGGYRVTSHVRDLTSGYEGVSRIIEFSRPLAISLTQQTKWPSGIGVVDGDDISIQFWTGAISPWNTESLLGRRTNFFKSAMGRIYLAYCPEAERERRIAKLRSHPDVSFGEAEEKRFRKIVDQARADGYAMREPHTWPYRRSTVAMAIRFGGVVQGMITLSYFTTAVPKNRVAEDILEPLRHTTAKIEETFAFLELEQHGAAHAHGEADAGF